LELNFLPEKKKIKQIANGEYHTIILLYDSCTLFSAGRNNEGQLGLGNNLNYNNFQLVSQLNQILK